MSLFTDIHGNTMTTKRANEKIAYSSFLQKWVSDLTEEAAKLMQDSIPTLTYTSYEAYDSHGDREPYQQIYFNRRKRLNTFAILLYLNPKQKEYQTHLKDILWSICEEWTWCLPAHINRDSAFTLSEKNDQAYEQIDLFSAETAFSLAEILIMHETRLPDFIIKRIRYEVNRRIFKPFLERQHHWEQSEHNWSSVCSGSIGASAIYLIEDDKHLQTILQKCIHSVKYFVRGLTSEGVCMEGYHYWQYGFGYYVYFADLLYKKTAGEVNLFAHDKVKKAATFQEKVFIDSHTVANFSDALEQASPMLGLSHYLHHTYKTVHLPHSSICAPYGSDPCYRFAPAIRDLLWFDETKEGTDWPTHESFFPEAQVFVKTSTYRQQKIGFAAKGGHNDEPHNHNDLGHFMIYVNGVSLLSDLGAGHYNKDYFSPSRYQFLTNGSQGHSVPQIGGAVQASGSTFVSKEMELTPNLLSMELTCAYSVPSLSSFLRSWDLDTENGFVRLKDSFILTSPSQIKERYVSLADVVDQSPGRLQLSRLGLKISLLFDQNDWNLTLHHTAFQTHDGSTQTVVLIDFTYEAVHGSKDFCIDFQVDAPS
ncbi:heparinase II/III family protein [Alkalicoccobacillus porphyridii]|nr:heparinase II/III family protein [Alkalicoccobacillus porphyridii]